jgi:hypothetical protein
MALFSAFWATLFLLVLESEYLWGKMSSINTLSPTFANWHAIPEPMTPEPKTTTFLILYCIVWFLSNLLKKYYACIIMVVKLYWYRILIFVFIQRLFFALPSEQL